MNISRYFEALRELPPVMHLEIGGEKVEKHYTHTFKPPAKLNVATLELLALGVMDSNIELLHGLSNGCKLFHSKSENDETGKFFIPSIQFFSVKQLAAQTAYMQANADREWKTRM